MSSRAAPAPRAPAPPALTYAGLAAALWAALALGGYLAIRPPRLLEHGVLASTLGPLLSLTWRGLVMHAAELVASAGLVGLIVSAAWGLGGPGLPWLGVAGRGAPEHGTFAVLTGLGVYALLAWAAAALGFYGPGLYAAILAAGAGTAVREWRRTRPGGAAIGPGRPDRWVLVGLGAVAVAQLGVLLSAASPLHVSDESIYHVGFARWYLWTRKAVVWPSNLLEFNPQLATMLYGTHLAFGFTFGVKWIHWVMGVLAALGLWHLLDDRPAWVRRAALLMYLTIPAVWGLAGRGFNDLFLVAYAAGALLAAQRARRHPGRRGAALAVLAGVFTGLAGSAKYTGLLTWLTLIPFLGPRRLILAGVAAAVVAAPWLARNWINIGNPVFPFIWRALGGLGWDEHQEWRLRKDQMQGEFTVRERLAKMPMELWNIPVGGAGSGPDGTAGPLLGMTLPLVLSGMAALEALALALYFLPVTYTSSSLRFLFPLLPLMFYVAVRRVAGLCAGRRVAGAAAAGFAGLLWFQATEYYPAFWREYDDPLPVLLGQETVPQYLNRKLYPPIYFPPAYPRFMEAIGETTPPGARVLLLGGYGGALYVPRATIFNALQSRPLPIPFAREAATPAAIARKFRQLGITHVAVNRHYNDIFFDFWKMWDWKAGTEAVRWIDYWRTYPQRVWHRPPHYELYALSRTPRKRGRALVPGLQDEGAKLLQYIIRKGDLAQSDAFLQSMLALFPEDPAFWNRAMETALKKGQVASARDLAAHVERLAPGSLIAWRSRATLLAATGRDAEAAALLERVLAREAWDAQGWLDLAQVYARMGRTERAAWCARTSADAKEFRPLHW